MYRFKTKKSEIKRLGKTSRHKVKIHNPEEVDFNPGRNAQVFEKDNKTLSVIMRCHSKDRMMFLEEAIFSVAIQDYEDVEVCVVIQNGDEEFAQNVEEIILNQPWRGEPKYIVCPVKFKDDKDRRSSLLNHGFENASGRFTAFLDDDDVVYQHGYKRLINSLLEREEKDLGTVAMAVGGCRIARTVKEHGNWFIAEKEAPFTDGRSRYDLYRDNFIPIHSYVIDRKYVDAEDLFFDNDIVPLEDYDLLLRLAAKYEFDFSNLDTFVCEYRIHDTNSLPYYDEASTEQIKKHERAFQMIEDRKKSLACLITVPELIKIGEEEAKVFEIRMHKPVADNPKLIKKALMSLGDNIYDFFEKYPTIEKRLSDIVHLSWKKVTKKEESPKIDND
jgi:glycosyltransferase involved in cell wall biosynthesis